MKHETTVKLEDLETAREVFEILLKEETTMWFCSDAGNEATKKAVITGLDNVIRYKEQQEEASKYSAWCRSHGMAR